MGLKTAKTRYNQALDYIRQVSPVLATDVDQVINAQGGTFWTGPERAAGDVLSISGRGHKKPLTEEHRMAIRALMLVQVAYFRPPYTSQEYASEWVLGETIRQALQRTQQDIDAELLEFLPTGNGSLQGVADAAERIRNTTGVFDPVRYRRTDTHLCPNPVCYHGVGTWLFSAGLVSKRWLARDWNQITAYTCNNILGDGQVVDQHNWDKIPKGWVWNVHRVNDKTTCHWGVSIGNDISIACNNTDSSPHKTLQYINGNTHYGKFKFSDLCDVLNGNRKYGHTGTEAPRRHLLHRIGVTGSNIVVRQFNPLAPPATKNGYY